MIQTNDHIISCHKKSLNFSILKYPDQFYLIINSYQPQPEYIYFRMFQGDPLSIETHLNNDWSLLLRNLKSKQDHHFELLQYNYQIVTQVRDENAVLFANDEIIQHQKELNRIMRSTETIDREEQYIYEKYDGSCIHQERAIKLMSRVGARLFQIYHNSIEKCKGFDITLSDRYIKVKKTLSELLNRPDGIYLDQIVKCIANYSKEKLENEIDKLKNMISAIENGEYSKLKQIYTPKEGKKGRSLERKVEVPRDSSKVKTEKQPTKTEQKQTEKQKKQKQKMMNNLYSTMELSKQQFQDDEGLEPQAKIQKLFNQILARNRYNSEQILEFQSKKELFEQRLKTFSEFIQKQNKKVTQVFVRKPIRKERNSEHPQQAQKTGIVTMETQQTYGNQQVKNNIQNMMTEGNIDSELKKEKKKMNTEQFKLKSISNKKDINDLPSLLNSFLSTNDNFSFKFDQSNRQLYTRTGRNIFPDIGKGTSLDQKTQITKIKIDKILRTTIKIDEKVNEGSQRKYENSRNTAIISREQAKLIEENHKIRMNIRHIDFGFDGGLRRGTEKQRLRLDKDHQSHSLYVKKAQIKNYEPRLNLIF